MSVRYFFALLYTRLLLAPMKTGVDVKHCETYRTNVAITTLHQKNKMRNNDPSVRKVRKRLCISAEFHDLLAKARIANQ